MEYPLTSWPSGLELWVMPQHGSVVVQNLGASPRIFIFKFYFKDYKQFYDVMSVLLDRRVVGVFLKIKIFILNFAISLKFHFTLNQLCC